jgi:hypothetical protein
MPTVPEDDDDDHDDTLECRCLMWLCWTSNEIRMAHFVWVVVATNNGVVRRELRGR